MKALITIPDPLLPALAALCANEKISRAEAIRRAIAQYLTGYKAKKSTGLMAHFGAWKGTESECDGVDLQRRLRAEWAQRDPGF